MLGQIRSGFQIWSLSQGAGWPRWRNIGIQVDPHMGVRAGTQAQSCWGLTQCWGETERKRDRYSVWKPEELWRVRHAGMNASGWPPTQGCAHWGQEYNRLVWSGSSKFANFFKEVILVPVGRAAVKLSLSCSNSGCIHG